MCPEGLGWAQVRVIVERLARRCGYDAVAGAMPQGDRRLLSHIQKEMLRKKRTHARAGSQVRHEPLPAYRGGHALGCTCWLAIVKRMLRTMARRS